MGPYTARDGNHDLREDIVAITSQEVIQEAFWDAVGEAYDQAYGGEI
jgi:hypothetical protein